VFMALLITPPIRRVFSYPRHFPTIHIKISL